ncbi:MAG: hypothetical protein Q8R82_02425 [Hyphomonadaceae bacterium]|nr:hypothetical protein [Hyphomonadaceae bacterium]
MNILIDNMQWVLLVCGLLTFSMIQAVIVPRSTKRTYFGESPDNKTTDLLVRNWGALIAAGGLLLIYAGFNPGIRPPVLIFIGAGKLVFIALVMTTGNPTNQARLAVILDSLMVALFAAYLVATQGQPAA